MRKGLLLSAAIAANLTLAVTASAVLVPWGPSGFNESGVGLFDTVAVYGVGTTVFNPMSDLSSPWTVGVANPVGIYYQATYAYGSATTDLTFNLSGAYDDTSIPPIEFYFYAWEGQVLKEKAHAWYDGGWRIDGNAPDRTNPVPEPFTLALGASALGLAIVRRRRATR